MATGRDAEAIQVGPGRLYIAPIGTTEPTTLTGALDSAWIDLGYTDEGSEFTLGIETENVEVAEELEPIRQETTARTIELTFALAQMTAANLQYVFNGGTIASDGAGHYEFTFPELGSEDYQMLLWQDNTAPSNKQRWLFRKVRNGGDVAIAHRRGAEKQTLPVTFSGFKPTGEDAVSVWMHSDLYGL